MVNFWAITKTQTTNRMKSWGKKSLKWVILVMEHNKSEIVTRRKQCNEKKNRERNRKRFKRYYQNNKK